MLEDLQGHRASAWLSDGSVSVVNVRWFWPDALSAESVQK
jgi:hypothetical protein